MARRDDSSVGSLTVSQMAERLGVSAHTLRFYETEGLVTPDRTSGGQRRFRPEHADLLQTLVGLRAAGLSLPQLRTYAQLHQHSEATPQQLELLLAHETQLRIHLATLRRRLRATEKQIERHRREVMKDERSKPLDEPPVRDR